MRQIQRFCLIILLASVGLQSARGFALLGPFAPWMTQQLCYQDGYSIGGPMNIGEGYRWNVPLITYGFDQSFIDYFGTNGIAAVESAIQILNDLPPASAINVNNYPLVANWPNYLARYAELYDLKSAALGLLLEQMGLAPPKQFVFCLRDFSIVDGLPNYDVLMRNYDPLNWQPSPYVNGEGFDWYVYVLSSEGFAVIDPSGAFAPMPPPPYFAKVYMVPFNVIASITDSSVADGDWKLLDDSGYYGGTYYPGLTRDDVGGLSYLLNTNTVAMENLIPGVHGSGAYSTNYVITAPRPGVDKITFQRLNVDPTSGQFIAITNQYVDTFLSNNMVQRQTLERAINQPDILFTVKYIGLDVVSRSGTTNWVNNGLPGADGPGVIQPPIVINFNRLGPSLSSFNEDFDGTIAPIPAFGLWGSFGRSTNSPITYPVNPAATNGTTVRLLLNANQPFPLFFLDPSIFTRGFSWNLAGKPNDVFLLQTSTNFQDWVNVTSITNFGGTFTYEEQITPESDSQRFYRTIPQ